MRSRSKHYNQQHPAIGLVACPTCGVPSGQKCIKTNGSQQNTETHVSRVKASENITQPLTPSDPNDRPATGLHAAAAAGQFEQSQR